VIDGNRRDLGVDADTGDSVAAHQLAYGDAADGVGKPSPPLEDVDARIMTKVQPPHAPGERFAKDRFDIDPARPPVDLVALRAWATSRITLTGKAFGLGGVPSGGVVHAGGEQQHRKRPIAGTGGDIGLDENQTGKLTRSRERSTVLRPQQRAALKTHCCPNYRGLPGLVP
jgi:hypothetical protein